MRLDYLAIVVTSLICWVGGLHTQRGPTVKPYFPTQRLNSERAADFINHCAQSKYDVTCRHNQHRYATRVMVVILINLWTAQCCNSLDRADIAAVNTPTLSSKSCIREVLQSTTMISCSNNVGLVGNSLRKCNAKENCYSSSSKAAETYLSPWSYEFTKLSLETVWSSLLSAVKDQGLVIVEADYNKKYILAYEDCSDKRQPKDAKNYYEFLIKPNDYLVLTRAVVDKTAFVYPLQQPIPDFNILQSKLDSIRLRLGFLNNVANYLS